MKDGLKAAFRTNSLTLTGGGKVTEQERIQLMNENYEHDKMELAKSEMKFGNMNYYLKKAEYLKKQCWKTAEDVRADIIEAMKSQIRG